MALQKMSTSGECPAKLHFLSKRGRCIQADKQHKMGSSAVRYLDTRSNNRQPVPDGAYHRCGESTKQQVEARVLYLQARHGRCYEPFHLTCARQAGLYLKMKLGGGQNTLMDPSQLRAYCHKHSPADWKAEHHTEKAFDKAVRHFKHHFHGQLWADSKSSALAITDLQDTFSTERGPQRLTLTNKKGQSRSDLEDNRGGTCAVHCAEEKRIRCRNLQVLDVEA